MVGGFFEGEEDVVGFQGDASGLGEGAVGLFVDGLLGVKESDPGVFAHLVEGHCTLFYVT